METAINNTLGMPVGCLDPYGNPSCDYILSISPASSPQIVKLPDNSILDELPMQKVVKQPNTKVTPHSF
jgi:hypothetical protein